jgi:hypothetical protein
MCQKGIMAKSTRHQTKAIATHRRSWRPARRHQTPWGATIPEWSSSVGAHGRGPCLGQGEDLDQSPAGVEEEHHEDARGEQQERPVEEALTDERRLEDTVQTAHDGCHVERRPWRELASRTVRESFESTCTEPQLPCIAPRAAVCPGAARQERWR